MVQQHLTSRSPHGLYCSDDSAAVAAKFRCASIFTLLWQRERTAHVALDEDHGYRTNIDVSFVRFDSAAEILKCHGLHELHSNTRRITAGHLRFGCTAGVVTKAATL
jgi:hypothetical protein